MDKDLQQKEIDELWNRSVSARETIKVLSEKIQFLEDYIYENRGFIELGKKYKEWLDTHGKR